METKIIKASNLKQLFDNLIKSDKLIFAPVKKTNGKVFFSQVKSFDEVCTDYIQTVFSAKSIVFPRIETLFTYTKTQDGIDLQNTIPQIPEVVIWGLRPCDSKAFDYIELFFLKDNPDVHFEARKEKTTLVSISCATADDACFCTSVESNPGDTTGSDILLTLMGDDYYAEILTEKGKNLVSASASVFVDSAIKEKNEYLAKINTHFSIEEIKSKLQTAFDNIEWKHESLGCVGCGACAFACPTCTCFDIQDEGNINSGKRVRCWDACGFGLFTKHASGHNTRHDQTERRRQRLLHKFKYSVENLGIISCVGCGRCIRTCPANINIFENIINVTEA
jgi:formate hydrogenlyase subunit 6/NADH:ubiquinone oxidoreductase subunit I